MNRTRSAREAVGVSILAAVFPDEELVQALLARPEEHGLADVDTVRARHLAGFARVFPGEVWCALLLTACGGEGPTVQTPQAPAEARFSSPADAGPPLQYAYDEARRLVTVHDTTGASAQYVCGGSVRGNGQTATRHEDFVVMPPVPLPVI